MTEVILPCSTNAIESEYSVYLYYLNTTNKDTYEDEVVWSPEKKWRGVRFFPNLGFIVDPEYEKFKNPTGLYKCTSSLDKEDKGDVVIVNVTGKAHFHFFEQKMRIRVHYWCSGRHK